VRNYLRLNCVCVQSESRHSSSGSCVADRCSACSRYSPHSYYRCIYGCLLRNRVSVKVMFFSICPFVCIYVHLFVHMRRAGSRVVRISVIFVTKIKTRTRIIRCHFQRTRTRIIVIQKTKTKLKTIISTQETNENENYFSKTYWRLILFSFHSRKVQPLAACVIIAKIWRHSGD